MNFHKGDMVMHWTHGIGQIVNLEERALAGSKTVYYVVQVRDMTVWVPADSKVGSRADNKCNPAKHPLNDQAGCKPGGMGNGVAASLVAAPTRRPCSRSARAPS